jgi:hypothetical protein
MKYKIDVRHECSECHQKDKIIFNFFNPPYISDETKLIFHLECGNCKAPIAHNELEIIRPALHTHSADQDGNCIHCGEPVEPMSAREVK